MVYNNLQAWTNTKVSVGVAGNSGTGKSTFINAVLELDPTDENAADTGVVETTMTMKQYTGKIKNTVFWDLPGVGTENFPRDKYEDMLNLQPFDYIIIIARSRFTENDLWLARVIKVKGIKFCFVRTHMYEEIENDLLSHPKTHNEQKFIDNIRKDCSENLTAVGPVDIFLIDSYERGQYDFNELIKKLLQDFKGMKAKILAMNLVSATQDIIDAKASFLRGRVYTVSVDICLHYKKETSESVANKTLRQESKYYKTVFGINDETLRKDRDLLKLSDLGADLNIDKLEEIGKRFTNNSKEMTAIFHGTFKNMGTILGLPFDGILFGAFIATTLNEMISRYHQFASDIFQNIPIDFAEKCNA